MSCGFVGNADIYGIGIRIGYYTQALAIWFSNYFLYREAKALRVVNNLFLFALLVAATIYFATASEVHVIEAFLMLQIGLVIGLIGITERSRYTSKYVKNSKERMISRIITIMAGGLFNVCFWWKLLDVMLPTPCNHGGSPKDTKDGTYIFYFLKASIYGWAGVLMKVQSLAAVVWTAPKIITFDAIVLFYDYRLRETRRTFIGAVNNPYTFDMKDRFHTVPQRSQIHHADLSSLQRPNDRLHQSSLSSHLGQGSPQRENKATTNPPLNVSQKDCDLIEGVDNAMKYIDSLFSIYPTNAITRKTRHLRFCGGSIRVHVPSRNNDCTDKSASYAQCLLVYLKTHWTNRPSFDLRWRLALHMTASGQHPSSRWPRLLHRMYTMGEAAEPPDWRHVAIASDILLTQIPLVITTRSWMLMAAYQFLWIAFLIIQVELTISWNNISGLQIFSSLGQLIPFILGVGGLIKVLWAKWKLVNSGVGEEHETQGGEYELAMAKFLESRKAGAGRSVVRAATA